MAISEKSTASRSTIVAFLMCLGLLLALAIKMIAPYIMAIVMGQILALISQKPYNWLRRRSVGAYQAGLTVTVAMLVIVVGPLLGFMIIAARQALVFGEWIATADHAPLLAVIGQWLQSDIVQSIVGEHQDAMQMARDQITSMGGVVSSLILSLAKGTPDAILQMLLAILAGFYLLVDRERFQDWLIEKLPFDREFREHVGAAFRDTAISVVWASMAAAATQALLITVGFWVLKIPGAFLAGGATFVFAWVPLLGSMPAMLSGLIFLFANGLYGKMAILSVIGAVAGVADNFVRPMVLRGRGEMHPLVSLVAIFGGINLFGVFGVFFGPILAAVLITFLQLWPIIGRREGFEFGDSAK